MGQVNVSIVSPVYRGETMVRPLVERLTAVLQEMGESFEIVLVNDASPDASWEAIRQMHGENPQVVGVNLSRNFGQHAAIRAGLDHALGQWVVVMDCDLQDRPEEIPRLLAHALDQEVDIVLARRTTKQFGVLKKLSSRAFYSTLAYLTGMPQDASVGNFGIYHRRVIDVICQMRQFVGFFPMMVQDAGFKKAHLDVVHAARQEGGSSYNLRALLRLALNVILASSDRPLRLSVGLGMGISCIGFVYGVQVAVRAVVGNTAVEGWASLMVSLWVLSGVIIGVVGVAGLYVGQIFQQVQMRPFYIVAEHNRAQNS